MATALVAFLFDCPVPARSVELLGSWDNFQRPYSLTQDKKRGPGLWAGCFTFRDILCDGDPGNLGPRRDGALKVGGTYWYYYRINDFEELHNPCQPSTTLCPLLPGQRLNILEVPMESGSQSRSQSSDVFTRNPADRYLTPVPPKPFVYPRLGDLCILPYTAPTLTDDTPRSATYPGSAPSITYSLNQRSKSASTSPLLGNASSFIDLRTLKQKVINHKGSIPHAQPRHAKELQIGAPVLISTTAEDMALVPLPTRNASAALSSPEQVANRLKEFSPLGSHPVDPVKDTPPDRHGASEEGSSTRRRSQSHPINVSVVDVKLRRERANSADTRRTRHYHIFSNQPWISSPKVPAQGFAPVELDGVPAPVLRRPALTITPPSSTAVERPPSRRDLDGTRNLKATTPLDKELPALPRYLVPAPLFACNSAGPSPVLRGESEDADSQQSVSHLPTVHSRETDLSQEGMDSDARSDTSSDRSAEASPASSSFTINSTPSDSPQHQPHTFTTDKQLEYASNSPTLEMSHQDSEREPTSPDPVDASEIPFLNIPELAVTDMADDQPNDDSDPKRRRRYGYSGIHIPLIVPELGKDSESKITSTFSLPAVAPLSERGSSIGLLEEMVSEFGFLGEAVH
ncbi:uncharacterized protein EI97DRAFT_441974 [Westerdykella ornata]|uniref:Uncharacterized protein n=1 Tax=Westerdykella ornata TaxID=318751 RepID=A0A6A6JNK3_WESOR|nr:uncharacterized protein EI97DRAFT_441974 [Westerdykella ornata]KAF2277236.1 hypothetical protein EI97DRAFT_441974 [Westerdykella ornata]